MNLFRDYQPEIFGVIVGLASLNIWYLSAVAIDESVVPKNYDYFMRAMTVTVGAFIGAFSAFSLKRYEDKQLQKRKQKAALNSALFVLVRQINSIQHIRRKYSASP